jgi:hypothetical protein
VSNSNIVHLPTRFESKKQPSLANRNLFASPRENFELLKAFSRIESPIFRRMIIQMARFTATWSSDPLTSTATEWE